MGSGIREAPASGCQVAITIVQQEGSCGVPCFQDGTPQLAGAPRAAPTDDYARHLQADQIEGLRQTVDELRSKLAESGRGSVADWSPR